MTAEINTIIIMNNHLLSAPWCPTLSQICLSISERLSSRILLPPTGCHKPDSLCSQPLLFAPFKIYGFDLSLNEPGMLYVNNLFSKKKDAHLISNLAM